MKIVVISRDTSSGTYEVWHEKVLNKEKVHPRALLQASNGAVVQVITSNEYAIGYVGLGYINSSVKAISVNAIDASAHTALTGEYPVSRALFMFTNGWPEGSTLRFINYVISPAGQKLAEKEGFVPIYLMP